MSNILCPPNIPLAPQPLSVSKEIIFLVSLIKHSQLSPLHKKGQNGADFQYGIIKVPFPLSSFNLFIVLQINLGGRTDQLLTSP
jgi:hypothetical protein